jgi:outer membrane biosynthesis protein TonB
MSLNYSPGRTFGLLPEPERSPASFISSVAINGMILLLVLYISATAKRVIEEHKYEDTVLIVPTTPPPPEKVKLPEPPKIQPPEPPKLEIKYEAPKINMPKPEPKPDLKPIQMEAKVNMPVVKDARPSVILSPQPKAALTAAMPAQSKDVKPSTAPVHLGRPPSPRLEIRMAA